MRADGVDDVVSAKRLMARGQRFQHFTADRRQSLRSGRANVLGVGDRICGATRMIVTWVEKHGGHEGNLEHVAQTWERFCENDKLEQNDAARRV